jgi:two-component system, OmpR family, sensor histidine kinase PhoQ
MHSLNARVTLSAAVVIAVFIALSAFALERAFRDSARSARHDRLLAQVYLLIAAAEVDPQGALSFPNELPDSRLGLPNSGLYAFVVNGKGERVWRSRSAVSLDAQPLAPLEPGVQAFDDVRGQDGQLLFVQRFGVRWTTSGGSYRFTFSVLEDAAAFEQQLGVYRRSLWGWQVAMAVLLLMVLGFTLRWGLSPLRRVAAELGGLERGVQQRLTGDYPDELRGLTDNLNALLARERGQQQRYRDALADLAHSLKTPLALMRGALRETTGAAHNARLLEDQIARMDRIVGYQLQRAATSGQRRLSAPQPLRPVVERLTGALAKVYADKHAEVQIVVDPALRTRVDEGDLTELLGNVLDNAFKWCELRVRVVAQSQDAVLTLRIEDDGPGVAETHARAVLERGVRADESMPGHGIGLAVVRDIVRAYDGSIEIARAELGGAFITIVLREVNQPAGLAGTPA